MAVLPLALDYLPPLVHLRGAPLQVLFGVLVLLTASEGRPVEYEGEDAPRARV